VANSFRSFDSMKPDRYGSFNFLFPALLIDLVFDAGSLR
jgi:hypothetical protein